MYLAMKEDHEDSWGALCRKLTPLRVELASFILKDMDISNVYVSDYSRAAEAFEVKKTAYYRGLTRLVNLGFMFEMPSYMNRQTKYIVNPIFARKLTSPIFESDYLANYLTFQRIKEDGQSLVQTTVIPGMEKLRATIKKLTLHFLSTVNQHDVFVVEYMEVRDLLNVCRADFNLIIDYLVDIGKIRPYEKSGKFLKIEYEFTMDKAGQSKPVIVRQ